MAGKIKGENRSDKMHSIIDNYLNEMLSEDIVLHLLRKTFSNDDLYTSGDSLKKQLKPKVHEELKFCYAKFRQVDNLEKFMEEQSSKAELLRQEKEHITNERDSVLKEYQDLKDEITKRSLAYQEKEKIVQNKLFGVLDKQALEIKQGGDCISMILPPNIAPIGYQEDPPNDNDV